jgi:hypothetical protein
MKRIRDAKDKQPEILERRAHKEMPEKTKVSVTSFEDPFASNFSKQPKVDVGFTHSPDQDQFRDGSNSIDDEEIIESGICLPSSIAVSVPEGHGASAPALDSAEIICSRFRLDGLCKTEMANQLGSTVLDRKHAGCVLNSSNGETISLQSHSNHILETEFVQQPNVQNCTSHTDKAPRDVKAVARNLGRLFDLQSKEGYPDVINESFDVSSDGAEADEYLRFKNGAKQIAEADMCGSKDNNKTMNRSGGQRVDATEGKQKTDKTNKILIANTSNIGLSIEQGAEDDVPTKPLNKVIHDATTQQFRNVVQWNDGCLSGESRVVALESRRNERTKKKSVNVKTVYATKKLHKQSPCDSDKPDSDVENISEHVVFSKPDSRYSNQGAKDKAKRVEHNLQESLASKAMTTSAQFKTHASNLEKITKRNYDPKPASKFALNETVKDTLPKGENTNESGYSRHKKRRRSSQQHLPTRSDPVPITKPGRHRNLSINSCPKQGSDLGRHNLECFAQDQAYSFL